MPRLAEPADWNFEVETEPTLEDRLWNEIEQQLAEAAGIAPPVPETYCPLPEYADELYKAHRYKVLYGGRGGARSWSVARALLNMAANRRLRILCAREIQNSIRDSVHRLLRDQIDLLQLKGYVVLDTEIRNTRTGSLFIFSGLRNVGSIKSIESIDICWVEEAERVSEHSWRTLTPSIRKTGSEIWITFNPQLETDPTYKRFILRPRPRSWIKKVGWMDNPWFPEELREEMEWDYATDPDSAAHIWGGECANATEAQILKGKWKVQEFEPDVSTWGGPYYGIDFGFAKDPATCIKSWVAPVPEAKGKFDLYVEYEAYKIGLENDDMAEYFIEHVPGVEDHIARADSARPETISYLSRPRDEDPDLPYLPRIVGCEKWPGSVEDGIQHLRSYRWIIIHPRCKHTAHEARHYSYKVDPLTGDVLPVIVDKHNHTIDPIRYSLGPLIKRRKKRRMRVHFPGAKQQDEAA